MTATKKRLSLLFIALVSLLSLFFVSIFVSSNSNVVAYAQDVPSEKYFYNNLTIKDANGNRSEYTLAKKFYEILEEINEAGDFKAGKVSYELSEVITSDQIKNWVRDGELNIPKAFSAARDAFLMDHPELFYVDMYKLTISASYSQGVYSAYIDTGREANVYRDKTFKSTAEVEVAITKFENKVKEIADKAVEEANKDTSNVGMDLKLAKAVNVQIAKLVSYDFGTLNDATSGEEISVSNMTFSAYGALILKNAVCSGFSSAFKVVMDYLDIPCIMVSGYSKGKDSNGTSTENNVGHSWNYVWLETASKEGTSQQRTAEKVGEWFAFDTTWNSLSADNNKYSAMNAFVTSREHITDGVISSSGYELVYPALSILSYKEATNPEMMNKDIDDGEFNYKSNYEYIIDLDAYNVYQYVSYNNKNSSELLADGLRLVTRYQYMGKDGELHWSNWQDIANSLVYYEQGSGIKDFVKGDDNNGVTIEENCTSLYVAQNLYHSQFAVLEGLDPDLDASNDIIVWKNIYFSNIDEVEKHMVFLSQLFENQSYGTYTAPPYIVNSKTYPYAGGGVLINDGLAESSSSVIMADKNAIHFKIVYDEPLHILDETKPIKIEFMPEHDNARNYASFVPFSDGQYIHLIADENGVMNTLEFKFKPSLMYEHNMEDYLFTFQNVGSAKIVDKKINGQLVRTTSDKIPNHAYYRFERVYMACPCVFGDGRLWVDCCAQPTLVDNSDLSAMDFMDESGNSTFNETLRSQMMLVVDKVSTTVENSMLNEIEASSININKNDIKSSQTYDINLQICGKYKTIPDGSYVKIALGFPEGYGPKDEGVTFKLFHRKHIQGDEYVIEEVPCVVTKFGIVATVTSFSPYMVAVVPIEKVTQKSIYASIDGKGGKLSLEDGQIRTLNEGDSCTYTITPDEGYKLYNVTLNGENVTERVVDGKLTISYDQLKNNNELDIQYIAEEAAERYEANNIIEPVKVVVSTEGQAEKYDYNTDGILVDNDNNIFIYILASVAAVIALGAIITLVVRKKKSKNN